MFKTIKTCEGNETSTPNQQGELIINLTKTLLSILINSLRLLKPNEISHKINNIKLQTKFFHMVFFKKKH